MTVVRTTKDVERLQLVVVAELAAEPGVVWELWENPRELERWWGPPTFPATFTRHEFVVGGESRYHMTGPDGERPRGWWRIEEIEPSRRIVFKNGLAGSDGEPVPGLPPMDAEVRFEAISGGTRMTVTSRFVSTEQMEAMLEMGMAEGMSLAIGQIDALVTAA